MDDVTKTPLFGLTRNASTLLTFQAGYPDMAAAISDALSNSTLAFIAANHSSSLVAASVVPGSVAWIYREDNLWQIYAPFLLVTLVIALWGIACVPKNEAGRKTDFSDFLAATRNADLDAVVGREDAKLAYRQDPDGIWAFRVVG